MMLFSPSTQMLSSEKLPENRIFIRIEQIKSHFCRTGITDGVWRRFAL